MKRIIGFLTAAAVAASAVPVLAASGDIAGQYYSTNIHTYVNGYEIDSINIGGQTLINAEDMDYYSFSVYWDDVARRLDIYKEAHETSGPPPVIKKSNYPSGMVLGNYYETDIVTYLDDKPITAYNTGGRTYIHAEQMRDWGYVVDWNEADRTLSITSPDRAGYEYTINLSEGSHPETDAFQDDGAGGFAISYENGKLTGCGDANLFGSLLSCDGTKYTISMGFYQNEGMFYSLNLQELLRSMCFYEEDRAQAETEENYARIDENVNIVINGHKAEKVRGIQWRGNGHVNFGFEITNIPIYKEDEIKSVYFSVGNTDGMEMRDIVFTRNQYDEFDEIIESLKKYPEDFMQSAYYADDYTVVYMCESPSMGVIKDRLYIIDNKTNAVSGDILEQVRQVEGFSGDILHPFAFAEGDNEHEFIFSCAPEGRTGDFAIDTQTGIVRTLAVSDRS